MAKNKFEILEKKVDLLIKGRRQRLSIPQFNSLLNDIESIVEEVEEEDKVK